MGYYAKLTKTKTTTTTETETTSLLAHPLAVANEEEEEEEFWTSAHTQLDRNRMTLFKFVC